VFGDTTTTDVILSVGPTLVALAALAFAASQQRRGFRHEREMADLADARALFDEAVVTLREAEELRYRTIQALSNEGGPRKGVPEAVAALKVVTTALGSLHDRMAVRLGLDHEAVQGFYKVTYALWTVAELLSMPSDRAEASGASDALNRAAHEWEIARDAFFRYVVRAVGSKLP
jgi:hypothetical protein